MARQWRCLWNHARVIPPREVAHRLARFIPPSVMGRLDLVRPSLRQSWGGPLNGQQERQTIVRQLASAITFDAVIETGTYRGTSTEFLSTVFRSPVETVEQNIRYYTYAKARLSSDSKIRVTLGDSRTFLHEVGLRRSRQTIFVYLDAHWEEDLPLQQELEIIASTWARAIVMIDDFAVPDDEGYGYDDYGPGKALVEAALPNLPAWTLHYPAAPSDRETGRRRGCCVLMSPELSAVEVAALRISRVL